MRDYSPEKKLGFDQKMTEKFLISQQNINYLANYYIRYIHYEFMDYKDFDRTIGFETFIDMLEEKDLNKRFDMIKHTMEKLIVYRISMLDSRSENFGTL